MSTDRASRPRTRRLLVLCGVLLCVAALSAVGADQAAAYGLSVSKDASRLSAVGLDGSTYPQSSSIYVFAQPAGVDRVSFISTIPR